MTDQTAGPSPQGETRVLAGKVALVTGAGAGLGRAIALSLANAGASVAVIDVDGDAARKTAALVTGRGVRAKTYHCDVADRVQVDTTWDTVAAEFAHLDIVVNNAGVSFVGPSILDTTDEAWHTSIGVMQTGVFFGMRAAARHLLPQGSGSVVNVSSIRGFSSNPGRIAYCAAKAAVLMMTKVAAAEWAPHGVRANAVAPGIQRTPMWDSDVERGAIDEDAIVAVVPAGTIGDPHEVGELVVFLCRDDMTYLNGSSVTIDGGLTAVPIG
jgi:NAD(P)-dependent dehydrogenase (short-subunit alcohol dehydrogenase family)